MTNVAQLKQAFADRWVDICIPRCNKVAFHHELTDLCNALLAAEREDAVEAIQHLIDTEAAEIARRLTGLGRCSSGYEEDRGQYGQHKDLGDSGAHLCGLKDAVAAIREVKG